MLDFLGKIFNSPVDKEVFSAYWNKLPEAVNVSWERKNKYIVGKVYLDEIEFMTHGRNADDFIKRVNEAVLVAYDVPKDYHYTFTCRYPKFIPSQEEKERLYKSTRGRTVSFNLNIKAQEEMLPAH